MQFASGPKYYRDFRETGLLKVWTIKKPCQRTLAKLPRRKTKTQLQLPGCLKPAPQMKFTQLVKNICEVVHIAFP